MGKLEKEATQRRRKGDIEAAVLTALSVSGVLALALLAPQLTTVLKYLPSNLSRFGTQTQRAAGRLVKKGYARWEKRGEKVCLRITEAGEKAIAFEQEKVALKMRKPKRWDGRWRMVAFDIPERRADTRKQLRFHMREVGFVRLQDSVWVYPYDCEDFMALLKADLKIGKDVLYAIADSIENDGPIRKHFGLPLREK